MESCVICQRGKQDDPLIVFEDANWIVRHSCETNILGYLLVESRRHFLDLSEASDEESAVFGPLLKQVVGAIRASVKPERVYTITLAEAVPHFHVHVIPRTVSIPRAYRGRGILSYPLAPNSDPHLTENLCTGLRQRLKRQTAAGAPART